MSVLKTRLGNEGFAIIGLSILALAVLFIGFFSVVVVEHSRFLETTKHTQAKVYRHLSEELSLTRDGTTLYVTNKGLMPVVIDGLLIVNRDDGSLDVRDIFGGKDTLLVGLSKSEKIDVSEYGDKLVGVYTELGNTFFEG